MAGVAAAALVTRCVWPVLPPAGWSAGPVGGCGAGIAAALKRAARLRPLLWLVPLAASAALLAHRHPVWNRALAALSLVPAAEQALDASLRSSLGAPDVRDLIVIRAATVEATLEAAEFAGARLDALIAAGELGAYDSPARYLPSLALQRQRREALPAAAELRATISAAVATLPVK